jgi:hypothetical protein
MTRAIAAVAGAALLAAAVMGWLWLAALDAAAFARAERDAAHIEAAQARAAAVVAGAAAAAEARRAAEARSINEEITSIIEEHDDALPPALADLVNGAADRLRAASGTSGAGEPAPAGSGAR